MRNKLAVVCLRWSKESLLISVPPALLDYAGESRGNEVQAFLDQCQPPLSGTTDREFIAQYRSPDACMDLVIKAIHGRNYKKGLHDEDLLEKHISPNEARRRTVLDRSADLHRLIDLLR